MAYGTSKANLKQTAYNVAATLTSAYVQAGLVNQTEGEKLFDETAEKVFQGLVAEQEAEPTQAAPKRNTGGGGGSQDPGTVVLNYGAFKGKTIQDVFGMDAEATKEFGYDKPGKEYVTWLSKNRNNKFLMDRATAFIERQRAGAAASGGDFE